MENQEEIIIPTPAISPTNQNDYTQITEASCNQKTARLLKALLSGRRGELTSINNFLFQRIFASDNQQLLNLLNTLTNETNAHISLLGNAISSFGFCPRFTNGQGGFWSARNVNYQTNPTNFIADNINHINTQISNYNQIINRVTNDSLKKLLTEIVADKQKQILLLQSLNNN